jgi:hypothetical protein
MNNGTKCPACDGCGQVANTNDREPWIAWENLPVKSAIAVVLGIVKPIQCMRCIGTGVVSAVPAGDVHGQHEEAKDG